MVARRKATGVVVKAPLWRAINIDRRQSCSSAHMKEYHMKEYI
jgi:hypothetical protein